MLKILVIGANGMLGHDVCKAIGKRELLFEFTKNDLDITDKENIENVFCKIKPDIVINCSGFTNVDLCEKKIEEAYSVNSESLIELSKACNSVKAKLVHISTDYVFDGESSEPYTIFDKPNPLNIYGKSKFAGENNVVNYCDNYLIVRTQWLFGVNGNNFVKKIYEISKKNNEISVVYDQFGSPTYTLDLAKGIYTAIKNNLSGIIHITNSGVTSWYDFTKDIFDILKIDININAVHGNHFEYIAQRPKMCILDNNAYVYKTGHRLRNYKDALESYLKDEFFL